MTRGIEAAPVEGALVIDKPRGKTSHDVVEAVRRIAGFRQVGHLGTLDPLATGVLVLLLGRATRLAQFYAGRRKRYDCSFRFGFATDTFDADGEPAGPDRAPQLDAARLTELAAGFVGALQQVPPAFSAKKIHGTPAHELARKKKPVELKPVEVQVYEFRLTGLEGHTARFTIECGAGTYVRALANDMGKLEGTGAHLSKIVRTAVGEFTLDHAVPLEEAEAAAKAGRLGDCVLPMDRLLPDLPSAVVLPVLERRIRHGARFSLPLAQIRPGQVTAAQGAPAELDSGEWKPARLRVFNQQEKLIAVAEAVVPRTYQPILVLDPAP